MRFRLVNDYLLFSHIWYIYILSNSFALTHALRHMMYGYTLQVTINQRVIVMMMIMMNCFCGMVDQQKAFSLISSRDHCQRFSPSQISDAPRAGFEPAQNLSSGLFE